MNDNSRFLLPSFLTRSSTWIVILTLVAFGLRVWLLNDVPPGWRDDELINSLVISQKVIDGNWAVYYPDASGHESLYHIMNAGMLALFGPGIAGIRMLSVLLGTMTVPLTFLVGRQLFGSKVGLVAAATLTFSFWSLMYSRIGLRHISLPFFMLFAFYFYWRALGLANLGERDSNQSNSSTASFILAGLAMGLGFYTYFASRGVPVILAAATIYAWIFHRPTLRGRWPGIVLTFGLAFIMALPLLITLSNQPESEARISELAVPLIEAQSGNLQPLLDHVVKTASMFHAYGDEEWLYNIPKRPLFGPIGAVIFWLGVLTTLWLLLKPLIRILYSRINREGPGFITANPRFEIAACFLLAWWLIGISPGFISVPPASLGHTIIAQSATYILIALPIFTAGRIIQITSPPQTRQRNTQIVSTILGIIIVLGVIWRDLPDYFLNWPERGMTRFLYRADIHDLADYLNDQSTLRHISVSGHLAGPWDRLALAIDLDRNAAIVPRWYNPERAIILSSDSNNLVGFVHRLGETLFSEDAYIWGPDPVPGDYELAQITTSQDALTTPHCFNNGLCLIGHSYDPNNQSLILTWELRDPLQMPVVPLVSNPPPPGIYAGPRLSVFAHLVDSAGNVIIGDDGLWVDITTLVPGDRFRQVHHLSAEADTSDARAIIFGLYDPMTAERILTRNGQDHIQIELNS